MINKRKFYKKKDLCRAFKKRKRKRNQKKKIKSILLWNPILDEEKKHIPEEKISFKSMEIMERNIGEKLNTIINCCVIWKKRYLVTGSLDQRIRFYNLA